MTETPDDFTEQELIEAARLLRQRRARARPPVRDAGAVFIRGEGGAVFEMSPAKMSADVKRRLQLGYLRQVNPDGSPLREPTAPVPAPAAAQSGGGEDEEPVPRPNKSAPKRDWVLYAVAALGLTAERAEDMTRQDLMDLPPDAAQHPDPTPGAAPQQAPAGGGGRPAENAPKTEWIAHAVSKGLVSHEDAANYTRDDLIEMTA